MTPLPNENHGVVSDPTSIRLNRRRIELVLEEYGLALGEIFPGLVALGATPILKTDLDQRSITTLRRLDCRRWSDLAHYTVGDLWDVPNAGALTVRRILEAARVSVGSRCIIELGTTNVIELGTPNVIDSLAGAGSWSRVDDRTQHS